MYEFASGRRLAKPRLLDDTMRFGLMWPNSPSPTVTSHAVAMRNPDVLDPASHVALAQTAEEIGMDFVFFADGYTNHGPDNARVGHGEPRIQAPIWAPVIMTATQHIGVVTTMHARYLSPVVLARIGANLDVLSGGRWGWNIVPGAKPSEEALFGLEAAEHDERYEVVAETLEAVRALWGARGEPIEFKGKYYTLEGTPAGPYPVQESPLIFNAGVSEAGRKFLASAADYAFFSVVDDLDRVKSVVDSLSAAATEAGRDPRSVSGVGAIGVVLAETHQAAEEKYQWIADAVDMDAARGWARGFLRSSQTYQKDFGGEFDAAARKIGMSAGSQVLYGTPEEVAEQFIEIYRATGLRGYMVASLLWAPEEVRLLGDVFPHLERAGVWSPPSTRAWSW